MPPNYTDDLRLAHVLADDADWALVRDDLPAFVKAVGPHRNWDRAEDPPRV